MPKHYYAVDWSGWNGPRGNQDCVGDGNVIRSTITEAFIEAKRREVEAATKKMLNDLSWPMVWLNPPYSDCASALLYSMKHIPVKIKTSNYGYASDLFASDRGASKEKMEDKNKTYYRVFNETDLYSCSKWDSELDALAEAERCANNNPGKQYSVMKALTVSKVVKPAITTRLK